MSEHLEIYPYHREYSSEDIQTEKIKKEWGTVTPGKHNKTRTVLKPSLSGVFSANSLVKSVLLFLLAGSRIIGEMTPFLPSFFVAASLSNRKQLPLFLLTSLLGCWVFGGTSKYFEANCMSLVLLSLLVLFWGKKRDMPYLLSIAVAFILLFTKALFLFLSGYIFHEMATAVFEAILTGALVPPFMEASRNLDLFPGEKKLWNKDSLLGLILVYFALLVAIGDLQIYNLSIRGVIARYTILLLAYTFGTGVATPGGVIVGFVPTVAAVAGPQMVGVYALSGLLGGFFRKMGKLMVALGFLFGHLLLSIYLGDPQQINYYLFEMLAAISLFMITPSKIGDEIKKLVPVSSVAEEGVGKDLLISKFNKFGDIFKELSRTFKQTYSEIEEKDESNHIKKLLCTVSERACAGCAVFGVCWEKDVNSTYVRLMEMFNIFKSNGTLTQHDIPHEIRKRCQRTRELALAVSCLYETYRVNRYWQKRYMENRDMISEQLKGISNIMYSLTEQIEPEDPSLREKEARLLDAYRRSGINVENVTLTSFEAGTEIDIIKEPCRRGEMECTGIIKEYAEEILGEQMMEERGECALKKGTLSCRVRLLPASCYRLEVGFAGVSGAGNVVSGDCYWHSSLGGGKYALLLSDGMGVGQRARGESSATVNFFKQLLLYGFDITTTVKTVNSLLSMRSTEETFATADIVIVDLYSGFTEFTKIGAAPSFIKRGKAVGVVKASSLPVGILNMVEAQTEGKKLRSGDSIIMMTDGVLEGNREIYDKEKWMQSVIRELGEDTAQEMAELILKHALAVADGPIKDDMSVMVAKFGQRVVK